MADKCLTRIENVLKKSSIATEKAKSILNDIKKAQSETKIADLDETIVSKLADGVLKRQQIQKKINKLNALEDEVKIRNTVDYVLKEFSIGILNGLIFAIISAIIVQLWFNDIQLSLIISISMVLNMIVAGLFGILVPISLKRFNIDPAIASSVFVTTITDVIGFVSFLGVGAYYL